MVDPSSKSQGTDIAPNAPTGSSYSCGAGMNRPPNGPLEDTFDAVSVCSTALFLVSVCVLSFLLLKFPFWVGFSPPSGQF